MDRATIAAVGAGALATVAMPPLRGTGWFMIPAMAILFGALAGSRRPGRVGWIFGLVHQATLLHWLYLLGPEAAISSRGLVPLAATGAILYASLYYLLLGWSFGFIRGRLGSGAALALVPVLWTAMEAWRGAGELGFPWCLSGAAFIGTPVLPLAAAVGELGLGAASAFSAAALAGLWRRRGDERLAALGLCSCVIAAWVLINLGAGWRAEPATGGINGGEQPVRIASVQANVALADKWREGKRDSSIAPYTELTRSAAAAGADLVIWAETSVPAYLLYDRELLPWVRGLARDNDVHLFAGFPDVRISAGGERQRQNGSGLFDPDGVLQDRYGKHHLLPFGERMPFQGLLPFLGDIDLGQAEWIPGDRPHPVRVDLGERSFDFAAQICYESIFPDLTRLAVGEGAGILVNITNDGWFGRTAGPLQHAAMARARAAECAVPLVRSANNGISFICDSRGRLLESTRLYERTFVIADVIPGSGGTLFVAFGYRPLLMFIMIWMLMVASALVLRRKS